MCKAIICGLAITAATAVGCSSGPSTGGSGSTGSKTTGEVGLKLTLEGGQTLTSLNYALTNAVTADDLSGVITLPTNVLTSGAGPFVVPTFEIVPVQAATGYTITLTGASSAGSPAVTCTGSTGPFAVTAGAETAVSVLVTCVATNTSGSVEVNTTIQNCPTSGSLTAINSTASTVAPNNTSTIFGAAVAPNPATLTYSFSVLSGGGTITPATAPQATGVASASVVYTCPATPTVATIQLVTADQAGAVCPASLTTLTTTVTCGAVPCSGVGTGTEATPDTAAGTCPAGQSNTLTDSSGNFCCAQKACFNGATEVGTGVEATPDTAAGTCPAGSLNSGTLQDSAGNFCCSPPPALSPCLTAAAAAAPTAAANNCVTCNQNTNGVCTPTEAVLVGIDIGEGAVTVAGAPPATGCYVIASNDGCIDSQINSSPQTSGAECGDLGTASFTAGNGFTGAVNNICVAALNCTAGFGQPGFSATCLGTSTATISTCLCGTNNEPAAACQAVASISSLDGPCATLELDGFPASLSSPSTLVGNFTTSTFPSGTANAIAQCLVGNAAAKTACHL
jgi:hypothetical protein